jgi:hypothetical protein
MFSSRRSERKQKLLASLGFYKAAEQVAGSGAGLHRGCSVGFAQRRNGIPADRAENEDTAERGDKMKAPIPPPVEQDSAGTVDEQSRYGEKKDARRAVAIECFDTLRTIDVSRKDRRQDGDGEGCNEDQIENQQTAHDALSAHLASVSLGD